MTDKGLNAQDARFAFLLEGGRTRGKVAVSSMLGEAGTVGIGVLSRSQRKLNGTAI
jgi:hypothetical protein